jgi:hypothetical protein
MRLTRMTTRRTMIAAAVVALIMRTFLDAYPKIVRRHADYQGRARQYAQRERMARKAMQAEAVNLGSWAALAAERRLKAKGTLPTDGEDRPPHGEESWASLGEQASAQSAWHARRIMWLHQEAVYYAGLRRKWGNAANLPFLPVTPDPPESQNH